MQNIKKQNKPHSNYKIQLPRPLSIAGRFIFSVAYTYFATIIFSFILLGNNFSRTTIAVISVVIMAFIIILGSCLANLVVAKQVKNDFVQIFATMVEPKFRFFQVPVEPMPGDAVVLSHLAFDVRPEALDAVDVVMVSHELLAVVNAVMLVASEDQTVIAVPLIRVKVRPGFDD